MDIEYRLPFVECENCYRFIMDVKRQTYLYPMNTQTVIKVTCKHQKECIKQVIKLKEMERKKHESR